MNNIKVGIGVMIIDNGKVILGHRNPNKKILVEFKNQILGLYQVVNKNLKKQYMNAE